MIEAPVSSGSRAIASVTMKPSISGIIASRSTSRYGRPAVTARRSSVRAARPVSTHVGTASQSRNVSASTRRLVALSSTTSTGAFRSVAGGQANERSREPWYCSKTMSKKNSLPLPGWLETPMVPPIIATRRAEIVSPNPVPPNCRVVEPSAWVKGSKIERILDSGMPMPVSRTPNRRRTSFSPPPDWSTLTTTSPSWVNLMALPTRFVRICRKRPASPIIQSGTSGEMSLASSSPFSWARSARVLSRSPTVSRSENGVGSRSSLPASIFEKSRMSLMMVNSESAEEATRPRDSRCSAESSVPSNRSVSPMMPFMGVRIS